MSSEGTLLSGQLTEAAQAEAVEPPAPHGFETSMQSASQLAASQVQTVSPSGPEQPPTVFDRWLRRELARLYDPVLHEPVPEHLRTLLEAALQGRTPGRH